MADSVRSRSESRATRVLLVTAHDWFASALQAVLEPEGFAFARVRSARLAVRDSELVDPEIVIIGENLPDMAVPELTSALRSAGLKDSVPILVYSPNFWAEADPAAGAQESIGDLPHGAMPSRGFGHPHHLAADFGVTIGGRDGEAYLSQHGQV